MLSLQRSATVLVAIGALVAAIPARAEHHAVKLAKKDPIGAYLAAAVMYLAAVYILIMLLNWLERASRLPGFDMEGKKA